MPHSVRLSPPDVARLLPHGTVALARLRLSAVSGRRILKEFLVECHLYAIHEELRVNWIQCYRQARNWSFVSGGLPTEKTMKNLIAGWFLAMSFLFSGAVFGVAKFPISCVM